MINEQRYRTAIRIPLGASNEYKQYAYNRARWEMSNKLYELLENFPNPCVVEITDGVYPLEISRIEDMRLLQRIDQFELNLDYGEEFRIEVQLTPVKYRDVTLWKSYPTVWKDLIMGEEKKLNIRQRIKYLFTGRL